MRLILIIPPSPDKKKIVRMIDCSHEAKANYLWQPNDFMIITSLLQPADTVTFIDGTADELPDDAFLRHVREARGDLLIFALSSVCWSSDHGYFGAVRKIHASVPLFVIGDIFLEPEYRQAILQEADGVIFNPYALDITGMSRIRREREAPLPGVALTADQQWFEQGKRMTIVPGGTPRHELFLKKGYRFPFARRFRFTTITTQWGCPFACSYCTDSRFPPLVRRVADVLAELDAVAALGISELFFADKTFGFSRENAVPLLEEMKKKHRFSWSCYMHPRHYDPDFLELMAAAGCHTIITGIDSANMASLKRYGRMVDKSGLEEFIAHANRIGVSICADFILGLGHETERDIIDTIRYALELPIDFASFNIAAPLPGSDIRRRLVSMGKWTFGSEGFDTAGRMGVFGNDRIDEQRLRLLRKKALLQFYSRPSYLFKRLKKTVSVEHFLIQVLEMLSMVRKG